MHTASSPKPKDYQKIEVGAYGQESDIDQNSTDNESDEETHHDSRNKSHPEDYECFEQECESKYDGEKEEEEHEPKKRNWWDSNSD